jgi:acetyl esterase/lipase
MIMNHSFLQAMTFSRAALLFAFLVTIARISEATDRTAIPLWPNGAVGSESRMKEPETVDEGPGKCNVTNIHHPSITPYLPETDVATGTAIIIAPGGGHRMLCLGHEGDSLGEWFAENGIAAFVLKYRLAREEGSTYTVDDHAMADTRRAIRMVRAKAQEWKINPERIGILGFSAGGELAALAAMDSDNGDSSSTDPIQQASCRPDFQVLIYPGSSSRFSVKPGMPPAFIALGANDRSDISVGMAQLYLKYKEAKVPCELHIYSNAGHGFGYRPGSTDAAGDWPKRLHEWLIDSGLLLDTAKAD